MPCAHTLFSPITGKPTGFICGKGVVACCVCGAVADHLCDYPMGKGKTCDANLCRAHAIAIRPLPDNRLRATEDPDCPDDREWVEFCPQHAALAKVGQKTQQELFQ